MVSSSQQLRLHCSEISLLENLEMKQTSASASTQRTRKTSLVDPVRWPSNPRGACTISCPGQQSPAAIIKDFGLQQGVRYWEQPRKRGFKYGAGTGQKSFKQQQLQDDFLFICSTALQAFFADLWITTCFLITSKINTGDAFFRPNPENCQKLCWYRPHH